MEETDPDALPNIGFVIYETLPVEGFGSHLEEQGAERREDGFDGPCGRMWRTRFYTVGFTKG